MGIVRRILDLSSAAFRSNPLENPGVPLSSPGLFQWLIGGDQTPAGETINEHNAMNIMTVFGCVRVIAESVGQLPLKLMQITNAGRRDAIEHPLYYLLAVEANPEMDSGVFLETMAAGMALTGNGYAEIERNPKSKQPVGLWPLHSFHTTPKRDPLTQQIYYVTGDGMPPGQTRRIEAKDMLHFRLMSLDGLKGISPIEQCRNGLGLAKAQENSGARHFANGSIPGGVLKPAAKLTPQQVQEAKESWSSAQAGVNQGKAAILPFGWNYEQIGLSNEDSQWLESRAFSRADIAMSIFRVPPHMVGDMSRMTGANTEQLARQFATFTLQPYLSKIEGEIIRKLISVPGQAARYEVEFDMNALVRGDFKTMMDGYSTGRINGWFSVNDVLKKLGENPIGPEGDVYTTPVNYMNAKRLLDSSYPPTEAPALAADAVRRIDQAYSQAYLPLFRDALNRTLTRNKRDLDTIRPIFQPVLEAICSMALGFRDGIPDGIDVQITEKVVADTLKGMSKRAAKWADDDKTELIDSEFNKVVRSIHIAIAQTVAAAKAVDELSTPESGDTE
ncbi:MAG TPA: phage portal protein [Terracidiphilus sp.]|jgi:HK97 family phage portal protein